MGRYPACRALAEYPVSVACDKSVDWIANESWDDPQQSGQAPGKAQTFVDAQDRVAIFSDFGSMDDENAGGIRGIHAMIAKDRGTNHALHRRQMEISSLIVCEDELGIG
jgi:hypothetical protein